MNIQLFPAVSMYRPGTSIRANFDQDKWAFKEFERVFDKEFGEY